TLVMSSSDNDVLFFSSDVSLRHSRNSSTVFSVWIPADGDTASGGRPLIFWHSGLIWAEEANFRFRLPFIYK
ncbi:hypothetical protein P7M21_26040, partial [Vibrio parahaemolyticus]|nr:hypothetical protein [Vibrio parahaemolyticus]